MANSWLRLWHDMPTDPKFGTVARVSGEHIALVLSVYLHLMVDASRNVTRGHVTVTSEDLATALNVTDEQIENILAAMSGRLIADGVLSGWDKRQVKREDSGDEETGAKSAAQRKKEQREREKQAEIDAANSTAEKQCHDLSHNVTLDKDKDKDKEKNKKNTATTVATPEGVSESLWTDFKKLRATKKAAVTQTAIDGIKREADIAGLAMSEALAMCCERGWTGFRADWASKPATGQPINKQEALEARNRAVAQRWASGSSQSGAIDA